MIKSSSDLLLELARHERDKLDDFEVSHRPTIGDMYEGLSKSLLELSVPDGIDLQVVSGFVEDDDGHQSGQIDCMLVTNAGRPIPYTQDVIWNIRDVIAVFEVKKTLYKGDLVDAFSHLNTVRDLDDAALTPETAVDTRSVARVFAQLTGRLPPSSYDAFSDEHRVYYDTLVREHLGPIRVIFGHHGYKSEKKFRDALHEHLTDSVMMPGFGVSNFPQLIVSGDHTMVKINGEPYVPVLDDDGNWMFYMTTDINPLLLVLEFIWTRLDRLFGLPNDAWGEDLDNDVLNSYLAGRPTRTADGRMGWNYKYASGDPQRGGQLPAAEPWAPARITETQVVVFQRLFSGAEVVLDEHHLVKFLDDQGVTDHPSFWRSMLNTGLVALSSDGARLMLLPKECGMAVLSDGQWVAGENNTGRLVRWVGKQIASETAHPAANS